MIYPIKLKTTSTELEGQEELDVKAMLSVSLQLLRICPLLQICSKYFIFRAYQKI